MTRNKPDSNKAEIVAAIRQLGAVWVDMGREAGFDGLLLYRGMLHIVEIKHPDTRFDLTPHEREIQLQAHLQEVDYCVITSVEEAVALLNEAVT